MTRAIWMLAAACAFALAAACSDDPPNLNTDGGTDGDTDVDGDADADGDAPPAECPVDMIEIPGLSVCIDLYEASMGAGGSADCQARPLCGSTAAQATSSDVKAADATARPNRPIMPSPLLIEVHYTGRCTARTV